MSNEKTDLIIRVINPNSNRTVTESMSRSLESLRMAGGPELDCITLEQAPFGIESQADIDRVAPLLCDYVTNDHEADAFVIACYSDPGVSLCRSINTRPVFGIGGAAALAALALGRRFGVISISESSVHRHLSKLREQGLERCCAGDRALGMSVAEAEGGVDTLKKMIRVGEELRDVDRAEVLIMACAGLAKHRRELEQAVGIPVVNPVQAAVIQAIGAVRINAGAY